MRREFASNSYISKEKTQFFAESYFKKRAEEDGGERADQCHVSRKQKREPKCLGVGFPLTPACSGASICSAVPPKLNHSLLAPRLLRPSLGGAKPLTTSKAQRSPGEGQPSRRALGAAPAPALALPSAPALQGGFGECPPMDSPEPSRAEPPAHSEKTSALTYTE